MGLLDTVLAATAGTFSDVFGETVVFKPDGGDERSIEAIVSRMPPAALPEGMHGHTPNMTIDVENNATTGISTTEIDTGKDFVSLAVRKGATAQDLRIVSIISQDAGRVILGVR